MAGEVVVVAPSTLIVVPEDGRFELGVGAAWKNVRMYRMNVPPWLNWLIGFTCRQQWAIKRRKKG